MTELTPHNIVSVLSSISKQIEAKASEIESLDEKATRSRAAFKVDYARVFMTTEGSMDVRRYSAELATADVSLQAELDDQKLRAAREAIKVLRDRLEIGRSLSAIMRMEWSVKE